MKMKKLIAVMLSVLMLMAFCCCCTSADDRGSQGNPQSAGGQKEGKSDNITVVIQFADGEEKELKIETDKEYLADALLEEKLITQEEYDSGFYTYIDGVRADYAADGAWWCVYENGESAQKGMNDLEIDNNDEFKIVYTPA